MLLPAASAHLLVWGYSLYASISVWLKCHMLLHAHCDIFGRSLGSRHAACGPEYQMHTRLNGICRLFAAVIISNKACPLSGDAGPEARRHSAIKAVVIGFVMTFFPIFDVPVFWPILLLYWFVLFFVTMKRQIKHMIKYRYIPFTTGKKARPCDPQIATHPGPCLHL